MLVADASIAIICVSPYSYQRTVYGQRYTDRDTVGALITDANPYLFYMRSSMTIISKVYNTFTFINACGLNGFYYSTSSPYCQCKNKLNKNCGTYVFF